MFIIERLIEKLERMGYNVVNHEERGVFEVRLLTNRGYGILQVISYDSIYSGDVDTIIERIITQMNMHIKNRM